MTKLELFLLYVLTPAFQDFFKKKIYTNSHMCKQALREEKKLRERTEKFPLSCGRMCEYKHNQAG